MNISEDAGLVRRRGSRVLKTFDRLFGIPAIRALGMLPHRRRPAVFERIGVLRTAAIGDTLLLTGVLRDVAAAFPSARIILVTGTDNASTGAIVAAGVADHLVVNARNLPAAIASLRRWRFDLLIDTGAWPRLDALLTGLSGARFRVGFRTAGQSRHYAYDLVVDHSARCHEIDNFRALVAAVGVRSTSEPALRTDGLPPAGDVPPKPFVVLHPWSGGYLSHLRSWPSDRWVELVERIRRHVATVVISAAPSQKEAADKLAAELARRGIAAVTRTDGIPEMAALLLESAAVVSVNTGIMHLGAQLGVPTVGLDGPTHPQRWGPVGPRTRSVVSDLPGCGYLYLGYDYDGQRPDCMLGVRVDAVEHALRELTRWER